LSRSSYEPDRDRNFSLSYNVEPGTGLIIDGVSGNATGTITQTAGADYRDIESYQRLTLFQDHTSGEDEQRGAKVDATFSTRVFGMPAKFQAGGRYNEQSRENKRFYRKWDLTGDSGSGQFGTAAEPNIHQFADPYFGNQWQFDVPIPNWISPYLVYDYFVANPDQFNNNYVNQLREANRGQSDGFISGSFSREKYGDRYSREQIYAGYGMVTLSPLPNLAIMAGARYEYTKLTATGVLYDGSNTRMFDAGAKFDSVTPGSPYYGLNDFQLAELLFTRVKGTKSYDKLFPNVQIKYEPLKNLVMRAAYTTNMGRPNFNTVMPGDTVFNHFNLIRRNNTELMPQEGENIDLNIEYYLPRSGLVSLTFFKQDIKNYINPVVTSLNIFNPDTGFDEPWTLETSENVGRGSNEGFTFEYRQKLGFITHYLRDVEFRAVFSAANPKAEYLRRTGRPVYIDPPAPGTPEYAQWLKDVSDYMTSTQEWTTIPQGNVIENSANVRLAYNGRRFSGSIAGYWRDDFARTIRLGTLDHTMQKSDLRWDLQLTYKISSRWSANFDWRNVTDEADDRRIFDRTGGYYTSGMVMNLGLRANF
jgi:TonB-dependent receptor